jgi:hypothetical protein
MPTIRTPLANGNVVLDPEQVLSSCWSTNGKSGIRHQARMANYHRRGSSREIEARLVISGEFRLGHRPLKSAAEIDSRVRRLRPIPPGAPPQVPPHPLTVEPKPSDSRLNRTRIESAGQVFVTGFGPTRVPHMSIRVELSSVSNCRCLGNPLSTSGGLIFLGIRSQDAS